MIDFDLIHLVNTNLMLAFLRDANTSQAVIDSLDSIYRRLLGQECFENLFPMILTDNGSEFSNPRLMEYGPSGKDILHTRTFYCDPSSPYQKGSIEVNHELIRRILPKGTSFDNSTQSDIFKSRLSFSNLDSHLQNGLSVLQTGFSYFNSPHHDCY